MSIIVAIALLTGCTGRSNGSPFQPTDTLHTRQTAMSIVQIATECGFSSHKYFSDRFHLYFSMTPSEFRKVS